MSPSKRTQFKRGDHRAKEAGRRGGVVSGASRRKTMAPWRGSLLDLMAMTDVWSWTPWRTFAKAITGFGHLMDAEELEIYRRHTRRDLPPTEAVDEAVMLVGTGGGKSRFAALRAVHAALTFDPKNAAEGELVVVPIIAKDRAQARNAKSYVEGFLRLPQLQPYVHRVLADAVELKTRVNLEIQTASIGAVRGYGNGGCAICDETAYWPQESAASSDVEIINAVRTRLARVPGSQLLILSSPHAPRGVLHDLHEAYFANAAASEQDKVLYWNASTLAMRPDHPKPHAIERALRLDPASAVAEYGVDGFVQFRQHQQALFDIEPVSSAIVTGRRELAPEPKVRYYGFLDAAEGARSGDSMTLAIAHNHEGRAVLDAVRAVDPPFNPADVIVGAFAPMLKHYNVNKVVGDRHAHGFVSAALRGCGLSFEPSALSKSQLYVALLSLLNSGGIELLDNHALRVQLLALQRRSRNGSHDSVDHPVGGHDDVANSAAGALFLASGVAAKKYRVSFGFEGDGAAHYGGNSGDAMAELIERTKQRVEAEAEQLWQLSQASQSQPMRSPVIWHVHGQDTSGE